MERANIILSASVSLCSSISLAANVFSFRLLFSPFEVDLANLKTTSEIPKAHKYDTNIKNTSSKNKRRMQLILCNAFGREIVHALS